MTLDTQKQQIGNSLKTIIEVFESCHANYRVLGSTLLVAYTNKIFRHINDVDVLLDINAKDCVFIKLKKNGFQLKKKTKTGFFWFEAKKDQCLGITFLLIGEFKKAYFSYRFMKFFELRILNDYLYPTEYNFAGFQFIGIPIASVIAGIKQSFLNPKRKLDKEVLRNEVRKTKTKTYNNISIHIVGIKLPYLYDLFSFLYNIYGGIRVLFGRKYEVWYSK